MKDLIQGFKETLTAGIDKVASAYDIPEENHAEFIEKVAEELEASIKEQGLDKEAGFGTDLIGAFGGGAVGRGLLGLGMGALGGLGAMAVKKVGKTFGSHSNRASYDAAYKDALSRSEILREADPQHIKRMADSIFSFAPTVASDSNVLTNILINAMHGDSIDLQTVRAVTELEEKLKKIDK